MRSIAVSLAIQIEEAFRGTICYFERPPHSQSKKPDRLIVMHTRQYDKILIEAFCLTGLNNIHEFSSELRQLISNAAIREETPHSNKAPNVVCFQLGADAPSFSHMDGYTGLSFDAVIPIQRRAA